jgi:hypothetical protein
MPTPTPEEIRLTRVKDLAKRKASEAVDAGLALVSIDFKIRAEETDYKAAERLLERLIELLKAEEAPKPKSAR